MEIGSCMNKAVFSAVLAVASAFAVSGLSTTAEAQSPGYYDVQGCVVEEVIRNAFDGVTAVRCATAWGAPTGEQIIIFAMLDKPPAGVWATNITPYGANSAQFLELANAAILSGKKLRFFAPGNASATAVSGCGAGNCRVVSHVMLQRL